MTARSPKSNVVPMRKSGEFIDAHKRHLMETSGLTEETLAMSRAYSEPDGAAVRMMLNHKRWNGSGGIVFEYTNPAGDPLFRRVRPDQPRTRKKGDGSVQQIKYEQPIGTGIYPYFTPRTIASGALRDTSKPLVFTEGEKKSLLLDQLGYATVGGAGVWSLHDVDFRNTDDRFRLHPALREHVEITGRSCVIVFDSDSADNDNVMHAARVLAAMLLEAGATRVTFAKIPPQSDGGKRGVDDLFVEMGEQAVRYAIDTAEPIEGASLEDPSPPLKSFRALRDAPIDQKLRMPSGYDIERDGSLWRKPAGDAAPSRVEREAVLIKRELEDLDTGELRVELAYRTAAGWRCAIVDRQAIADTRAAINAFAPIGLPIDSGTSASVVEWLRDLEHKNRKRTPRSPCVTQCGWRLFNGRVVFVLDEPIETGKAPSGIVFDGRGGRARLTAALRCAGDAEAHLAALDTLWKADHSGIAATALCAAFAAPLLHCLSAPNFALHLGGDSSRGKSSILKITASIYGDPRSEEWVASWNSTAVGLEVRAATLCDLPLCIDEAGVVDEKQRERAVYMLINGTGRVRGEKTGGLRDTASWRTVVLSTGEHLLATTASNTGAQARVLQFFVHGIGDLDAAGVDALRSACEENYGHVGRRWLEFLASVEDWAPYRRALKKLVRSMQEEVSGGPKARQTAYYGLLAFTEQLLHQAFDLGTPDGSTIRRWLREEPEGQQGIESAAERALDLVQGWRRSHPGAFGELRPDASGRRTFHVPHGAREVFGYATTEAMLFVPQQLAAFLAGHGLSREVVLHEWARRGWLLSNEGKRLTHRIRAGGELVRFVALRSEVFGGGDLLMVEDYRDGG